MPEFSFSGAGLMTIPLTQGVTINAGLRQALYVSMLSTNNNTYLKYGANYTTDDRASNSKIVVEDTNLVVYPGAATKYLFGEYLTPRYFSGTIGYDIVTTPSEKMTFPTNTPTKNPTRRPRRRRVDQHPNRVMLCK